MVQDSRNKWFVAKRTFNPSPTIQYSQHLISLLSTPQQPYVKEKKMKMNKTCKKKNIKMNPSDQIVPV